MPTKLSRYAEGIMEAAWLAAIMLVPVFFDIYSSRIFEPDKLTLLRTLALVILAAWAVKLFEEGGFHWEHFSPEGGWFKFLVRVPLVGPVLALVAVYILSTVFSVSPYTSLWGSYQRLQGTYTTFAYIVVFASLVINLRRRAQLERLISVAILSSLPVSLYGVLQHYGADPIPWGADVTGRVAANLGNSIFVAAYLIMVFPLTLMRAVESFEAMLADRGQLWPNFARSTIYIFILAIQAIAIFFSGSRGPWLGLGASLVVVWLGISLIWRKRWMTTSGVVIALVAGVFLVTLNIPNGPLESLRDRPEFGRLGQLLDAGSRTGQVRTLIWQGAVELVLPHAPLEYPDGHKDPFNIIRPLIGYGPESMYVAYNRFYQPELTLVEKRNASPDRSHNETWDSLIITGVLGLIVYLTLFGSILYFGLKWLGWVPGKKERNLYLTLYIACGLLSTIGFVGLLGLKYFGVALPFGMIFGVIVYMILISLLGRVQANVSETDRIRAYIILGLLAAITAHFVEINFGIAIAATRTYFWAYTGLLLLVGYILPRLQESAQLASAQFIPVTSARELPPEKNRERRNAAVSGRRKSSNRRGSRNPALIEFSHWKREGLVLGLIVALLLTTLGFSFVSNVSRASTAFGLVEASLTQAAKAGGRNGILPLMLTTWLAGIFLFSSESILKDPELERSGYNTWLKMLGLGAALSLGLAFVFWLWNATGLAALGRVSAQSIEEILAQVRDSEGLLTTYYLHVFLILFGLAVFLPVSWPAQQSRGQALSLALASALMIVALMFSAYSNLRVIQADIAFKTGDLFAKPDSWPVAIAIYDRANSLAPNEDYYYLFLGRAYLEYAKSISDASSREQLIEKAAQDLRKAQEINPLNTDHTANLARLYSLWATFTDNPDTRQKLALTSDQYFSRALNLSPNSARLWDEWSVLYLNILNNPDRAYELLQRALQVDPYYDWTYALIGDYYSHNMTDQYADQPDQKQAALETAAQNYQTALDKGKDTASAQSMYNYTLALGSVDAQLGQYDRAILAYQNALQYQPDSTDSWQIMIAIAQLYARQQDNAHALDFARNALSSAPENQKQTIMDLITQLGG